MLAIGTLGLAPLPLILAMSAAGLLSGMIMPSRDMLVRAAAPPGAMGRTFGIVTSPSPASDGPGTHEAGGG